MTSEILSIVIDERKNLENIDSSKLMSLSTQFGRVTGTGVMSSNRHVFKDYLLSSDPYYLDPTLD